MTERLVIVAIALLVCLAISFLEASRQNRRRRKALRRLEEQYGPGRKPSCK